jgi:GNAT superfamily N-acetyltransferase
MHELEPKEYAKARPLFARWRPYLVIFAVIDGHCPGQIWVDDRDHPRAALLWDHAEGELYLAGDASRAGVNRALNDCLRQQIRPYAQAHLPHLSEYTLYCDPGDWEDKLDVVLAGLNPMAHRRKLYAFKALRVDWRAGLPDRFTMARIDERVFGSELAGIDLMREWLLGSGRSAADFGRSEIGFCLIHARELVAWCASEYTCEPLPGGGSACHVGIYTRAAYRRRGLGTLVAAATVEACLAQGIEWIGWHCWERNAASAATAERVGFQLAVDRPVYNGCFNPFDNLLLQAYYHSQAGRLPQAVNCWEQAFEMWEARDPDALASTHCRAHPETVGGCYYAAGRARAGWGEGETALRHLNRAIDNGWQDVERLLEDSELAGLHGTAGWEELLDRLRTRVGRYDSGA